MFARLHLPTEERFQLLQPFSVDANTHIHWRVDVFLLVGIMHTAAVSALAHTATRYARKRCLALKTQTAWCFRTQRNQHSHLWLTVQGLW